MRLVRARRERPITDYDSRDVWLQPVCEYTTSDLTRAQMVRFAAGGGIGLHPTGIWQVFAVVDGAGWVTGGDERAEVVAGDVVVWEPGEQHESGTDVGMLVCIVQTTRDPLED